jgi:hypothetical protein
MGNWFSTRVDPILEEVKDSLLTVPSNQLYHKLRSILSTFLARDYVMTPKDYNTVCTVMILILLKIKTHLKTEKVIPDIAFIIEELAPKIPKDQKLIFFNNFAEHTVYQTYKRVLASSYITPPPTEAGSAWLDNIRNSITDDEMAEQIAAAE